MTLVDLFREWLERGHERVLEYHAGDLAFDRRADPGLDEAAAYLIEQAECDWPVLSECSHVRGEIRGKRRVRLHRVRQHNGDGFLYLAEKIADARAHP